MSGNFIQEARERMESKGTVGKFGRATPAKIAAGKREGGVRKKEAVFAENMKKIAEKRKRRHGSKRGRKHNGRQ